MNLKNEHKLRNSLIISEPMTRFELVTSSLPRKRSTPELHRLNQKESERPGSNRRHSAWKADALPTELLPHHFFNYFN